MKTVKTNTLIDTDLEWVVAKCEGFVQDDDPAWEKGYEPFSFSTDWYQGGPIIERERICLMIGHAGVWLAYSLQNYLDEERFTQPGPTPLVAAMRCYVASKLGDEVEIPEGML